MKRVTAILALALLIPSSAQAITLYGPEDRPTLGLLQRWANRTYAPTPHVRVRVVFGPCVTGVALPCALMGDPPTIWIDPTDPFVGPHELQHEIGHEFDYLVMRDWARDAFRRLLGTTRPWRGGANPPNEKFAEAYAFCAQSRELPDELTAWSYRYLPTKRLHRRVCRLIWQAAGEYARARLYDPGL